MLLIGAVFALIVVLGIGAHMWFIFVGAGVAVSLMAAASSLVFRIFGAPGKATPTKAG